MSSCNLFCRNELQREVNDQMGLLPLQLKVISWVDEKTPLYTGRHALPPLEDWACVASVGLFTCVGG